MKCQRCDNSGFIELDDATWKPCPACRPDQHAKWATGQFDNPRWNRTPTSTDIDGGAADPAIVKWLGDVRTWLAEG